MNRAQHGFSLLEVLVSVLIVGIGLLGISALQMTTSVYTESSMHRGHTSMLAREIIERMRVNVDQAKTGGYDINTLPTLTTDCTGAATDCTPAEIRQHDLRTWSARVTALLPGGDAIINTVAPIDPEDPVEISVTLTWTGRNSAGMEVGASAAKQQVFTFQLHGMGG